MRRWRSSLLSPSTEEEGTKESKPDDTKSEETQVMTSLIMDGMSAEVGLVTSLSSTKSFLFDQDVDTLCSVKGEIDTLND